MIIHGRRDLGFGPTCGLWHEIAVRSGKGVPAVGAILWMRCPNRPPRLTLGIAAEYDRAGAKPDLHVA